MRKIFTNSFATLALLASLSFAGFAQGTYMDFLGLGRADATKDGRMDYVRPQAAGAEFFTFERKCDWTKRNCKIVHSSKGIVDLLHYAEPLPWVAASYANVAAGGTFDNNTDDGYIVVEKSDLPVMTLFYRVALLGQDFPNSALTWDISAVKMDGERLIDEKPLANVSWCYDSTEHEAYATHVVYNQFAGPGTGFVIGEENDAYVNGVKPWSENQRNYVKGAEFFQGAGMGTRTIGVTMPKDLRADYQFAISVHGHGQKTHKRVLLVGQTTLDQQ